MTIIRSESSMTDFREIRRVDWAKKNSFTRREGYRTSADKHRERVKQEKSAKKYQNDYSSDLRNLEYIQLGSSSEFGDSMNSAPLEVPHLNTPLMPSDSDTSGYKDEDCIQGKHILKEFRKYRTVLGEINTLDSERNKQDKALGLNDASSLHNKTAEWIIACKEESTEMPLQIAHIERQEPRFFDGPLELSNCSEDSFCNSDHDGYRDIISEFFPYHDFFWNDELQEITETRDPARFLYYETPAVTNARPHELRQNSGREIIAHQLSSISTSVNHYDKDGPYRGRSYGEDEVSLLCPPQKANRQPPEVEGYFSMIIEDKKPEKENENKLSSKSQNLSVDREAQLVGKLFNSQTPDCSSANETGSLEPDTQKSNSFAELSENRNRGKALESFVTEATDSSFLTTWAEGLIERFPAENDPRVSIYTPSTSAYSIDKESVFLSEASEHSNHGLNSGNKHDYQPKHSGTSSTENTRRTGGDFNSNYQAKARDAHQEQVCAQLEKTTYGSDISSFPSRIGSKILGLRLNRNLKKMDKGKKKQDYRVPQVSEARNSIQLEYVDYGTATMDTLRSHTTASPLGRELDAMLDEAIADQHKYGQEVGKIEDKPSRQSKECEEDNSNTLPHKPKKIFKFKEHIQKMRARPHTLIKPAAKKSLESFSNIPKVSVQYESRTTRRGLQLKGVLKRALESRENKKPSSR